MRHKCVSDMKTMTYGDRVVQLIRGNSFNGYITPAFSDVMLEWHLGCFKEFRLVPQNVLHAPYRCQICLQQIVHGDDVVCFVVGKETGIQYSICESRGYSVYSVTHTDCARE